MGEKLVSVIIPIYNTEKYVVRCIESVRQQTYQKLEIILVNDGSTDGSGKICDDYIIKDNRIKVVHKANGGLSSARNAGIDKALGEFVSFIDSDDYILPNMYEIMIKELCEKQADIAMCGATLTYGECPDITLEYNSKLLGKKEVFERFYTVRNKFKSDFSVCKKVYRRECIGNIRFEPKFIYEDILFNFNVYQNINKAVHIPLNFYCYYQREGSISDIKSKVKSKATDLIKVWSKILEEENNSSYHKYIKFWLTKSYFIILLRASMYGVEPTFNDFEKIKCDLLKKYRKNAWRLFLSNKIEITKKIAALILFFNYNLSGFIGRKFLK